MEQMSMLLANSLVETYVQSARAFCGNLKNDVEAILSGISHFIRVSLSRRALLPLPAFWSYSEKIAINEGAGSHMTLKMLVPWTWTSQHPECEKLFLLVKCVESFAKLLHGVHFGQQRPLTDTRVLHAICCRPESHVNVRSFYDIPNSPWDQQFPSPSNTFLLDVLRYDPCETYQNPTLLV